MSMRPKRLTAARTACSASSVLVTSSLTASRSSASPTAFATASGLRPVATTALPAASAAFAKSTPMPRPAPVTNQIFLSVIAPPRRLGTVILFSKKARNGGDRHGHQAREPRVHDLRRARITHWPAGYGARRVPGLRREEVASAPGPAGLSAGGPAAPRGAARGGR